ncbi:MAG: ankyrin repeat domain-containing protein [Gammaproteobacteria bacterium]|nr:ankyrin repeat domain-containing protein [Gammaproteobacteria bacterium]
MLSLDKDDPRAIEITAAIRVGDTDRVAAALKANPGLETAVIRDGKGAGRTLLHMATDWPGHFSNVAATIAVLASAGADPNAGLYDSPIDACETPLHWAASSDDVAAIDALLDNGADIEAPGAVLTWGTAMSDAVIFAQWNAARRLLARGAKTTLTQAAALGLLDRVRELCTGSEPARNEVTAALWHACRGGQQSTADYLLGQGADLHWVGFKDWTPLQAAEDSGNHALVDALCSRGARRA